MVWRDCKTLLSGGEDGKIHVWNLETGTPTQTIDVDHDIYTLAFSPDTSQLACGSADDVVRIYSLSDGKVMHSFDPKTGSAEFGSVAWSPDGSLLAIADLRVLLWNVKTEKQLHGYQIASGTHNVSFSQTAKPPSPAASTVPSGSAKPRWAI